MSWRGWVRFDGALVWLDTPTLPRKESVERVMKQTYGELDNAEYVVLADGETPTGGVSVR